MTLPSCHLDPARTPPAASYRDPALLSAEKECIWHGDWVFATTEDALPEPGDQLPVTIGDQPVLLLRNRAGALGGLGEWFSRTIGSGYALPDFLSEDRAICERVQRGYVGDFAPGRLVPLDRVVADFGHYLNWRLNRVDPPPVHSERAS